MNRLTLKQVLYDNEIRDEICNNLNISMETMNVFTEWIIDDNVKVVTSFTIKRHGHEKNYEFSLYESENRVHYLLEARAFDKDQTMTETYLQVLDRFGNIIPECIDDVWGYADWELL